MTLFSYVHCARHPQYDIETRRYSVVKQLRAVEL